VSHQDRLSFLQKNAEKIEHVLQRAKTLEEAAEKLIHRAKKAGGKDNITALIIYTEKAYAQANLS